MRQYELTYLVSDTVSEANINKITGKINGLVDDFGGKLIKEEIWKRRKLAYTIKKQEFATYVTIDFDLAAEKINGLEKQIRLTPQIIRHLALVLDQDSEALTLTVEEIADTKEIEAAIGSDKSFEVVEGETEESRRLQSIREQENENQPETEDVKTVKPEEKTEEEGPAEEEPALDKKKLTAAAKKAEKESKKETEADRLAKLDEQLDNLLKDEDL